MRCFKWASVARLVILAVLVVLVNSGCSADGGAAGATDAIIDSALPVEVATVTRRSIGASYSGVATLEAESAAQVTAKVSGVLLKLMVEEGDRVKAGQTLAQLDDDAPRLNLAKVESSVKKLENDYRRASEMFDRQLLSAEQNDKIRYELETQRATRDLARLELSYTRIVAPISGVITKRMVKTGNFIQINQALFQIDNFDPLLAVLNVPERQLNTLSVGQTVAMQVDALPGEKFDGRIQRISPVIDAGTGTFRVTCEFRDSSNRLKSGMFGRLQIAFDRHDDALAIPRSSLMEEDGESAVFLLVAGVDAAAAQPPQVPDSETTGKKGNDTSKAKPVPAWVAQRRVIRSGYGESDYVEVLEGLNEGDRVITVGRNAVRDGTPVQVIEEVQ